MFKTLKLPNINLHLFIFIVWQCKYKDAIIKSYYPKGFVLKFEWSDEKSDLNIEKHQISFDEAKEVFLDPMHISKLDHRFDYFEERWITLGTSTKEKILVVANMFFDENGEEVIRIISARRANQKERIFYEQH